MKLFEPERKGEWHVLRLPAILEDGTSLWPERFKIENVLKLKTRIGDLLFFSLYQQNPLDVTERIFSNPIDGEPPRSLKLFRFGIPRSKAQRRKKILTLLSPQVLTVRFSM